VKRFVKRSTANNDYSDRDGNVRSRKVETVFDNLTDVSKKSFDLYIKDSRKVK